MLEMVFKVVKLSKFILVVIFASVMSVSVFLLLDILVYMYDGSGIITDLNKNFVFLMVGGGILLSALIASFAIILNIASMQDIEKGRLVRDLFEKRIKIYKEIAIIINTFDNKLNRVLKEHKWYNSSIDDKCSNYLNETYTMHFYFSKDFINYKKEIDSAILELIELFEINKNSGFPILNDEEEEKLKIKSEYLKKQLSLLDSKFKSYKIKY